MSLRRTGGHEARLRPSRSTLRSRQRTTICQNAPETQRAHAQGGRHCGVPSLFHLRSVVSLRRRRRHTSDVDHVHDRGRGRRPETAGAPAHGHARQVAAGNGAIEGQIGVNIVVSGQRLIMYIV